MQTLFIADLHLSDHTPDLNDLFVQFLQTHTGGAAALYILGDLFEAWTGDDDDSPTANLVAQNIQSFSQFAPVYFIAGNRDFLLGKDFAQRANMTLLPEHHLISLYGQHILLTHGDEMCTDDVAYLRYRAIIRQTWLQKLFLCLPFHKRKKIAENIRAKSRARKAESYAIADVTATGIQAACQRYRAIHAIIHGHTHRPAIHQHTVLGREIMRYVLPDWLAGKGGYLAVDEHGWTIHNLSSSS